MLSLSCKAAIKAVIYLGSQFESGRRTGIREVADYIDENEHTVGKLLQKLVRENIIKSAKGPNGGFYITARQRNQRVITIVEAIDGKEVFSQCGLGLSKCSENRPCPFHDDFKPIREGFKQLCLEKRISELDEKVNNGLFHLIG